MPVWAIKVRGIGWMEHVTDEGRLDADIKKRGAVSPLQQYVFIA